MSDAASLTPVFGAVAVCTALAVAERDAFPLHVVCQGRLHVDVLVSPPLPSQVLAAAAPPAVVDEPVADLRWCQVSTRPCVCTRTKTYSAADQSAS